MLQALLGLERHGRPQANLSRSCHSLQGGVRETATPPSDLHFDAAPRPQARHRAFGPSRGEGWQQADRVWLAREFPIDHRLPHDALLYCDLTTGPTGEPLSIDERLVDIRARYGPEHLVSRFINVAEPEMRAAVARAESLLSTALILA